MQLEARECEHMISPAIGVGAAKKWPSDPYKGLTYYSEGDLPLFAGRDSDIDAVCGSIGLGNIRILLLHGLTGCGKSSFLRAGLIPALEEEIAGYEFLRDENGRPDFVRSTDDPSASLARRVHRFIKREYSSASQSKGSRIRERLRIPNVPEIEHEKTIDVAIPEQRRTSLLADAEMDEADFLRAVAADPRRLVRTVEQIASQRPRTFVLVIDQAEEVVTLKPDSTGDPARIQFFDFLSEISRSRYDLKVIICFRTEYHGQFYAQLRYGADVGRINDYYLRDFTEEQLLEAILRPTSKEEIRDYGVPNDCYHFQYEGALPQVIAKALLAQGLSGGVLPALQIVCRRLYEGAKPRLSGATPNIEHFTITEGAYTSLGGVAGQVISYLQSELEDALREPFADQLGVSDRRNEIDGWREVLLNLVKPQINGTVTSDVIPEETLKKEAAAQGCKIEPQDMFEFLNDERRRILRFVDITNLTTKEVIRCCSLGHDVLAGAFKEWSERTRLERSRGVTFRSARTMSNVSGKAYALNAITPMKPWKTPILRLIFFSMEYVKSLLKDLEILSFVPFARWIIMRRDQFPRLSEKQPREKLQYDYLIFIGNFNAPWNQCIESFCAVLSNGLDSIYRWSEDFPGAKSATQFTQYIASVQFATDYYYTAYPLATTRDVVAAHRVQAALDRLGELSDVMSDEVFESAYLEFVLNVQRHLGGNGMEPFKQKNDE
jgi:hypothetical protein